MGDNACNWVSDSLVTAVDKRLRATRQICMKPDQCSMVSRKAVIEKTNKNVMIDCVRGRRKIKKNQSRDLIAVDRVHPVVVP